jgi:hypothetical protein
MYRKTANVLWRKKNLKKKEMLIRGTQHHERYTFGQLEYDNICNLL